MVTVIKRGVNSCQRPTQQQKRDKKKETKRKNANDEKRNAGRSDEFHWLVICMENVALNLRTDQCILQCISMLWSASIYSGRCNKFRNCHRMAAYTAISSHRSFEAYISVADGHHTQKVMQFARWRMKANGKPLSLVQSNRWLQMIVGHLGVFGSRMHIMNGARCTYANIAPTLCMEWGSVCSRWNVQILNGKSRQKLIATKSSIRKTG